jgi:hypothetical protein
MKIKNEFNNFVSSLRNINIKNINILISDVLFIVLSLLGIVVWNRILSNKALALQAVQNLQPGTATGISADATIFFITAIIATIIFVLYLLAIYSLSQGYIWNLIYNKKLNKEFLKKFALLNVIALPLGLILVLIAVYLLSYIANSVISFLNPYLFNTILISAVAGVFTILILGPIFLYFANIVNIIYINFMKNNKIFQSIANAFKFTFNKGNILYLPYVFTTLLYFIASLILLLFRSFPKIYMILSWALLLTFISWMRVYLKELID